MTNFDFFVKPRNNPRFVKHKGYKVISLIYMAGNLPLDVYLVLANDIGGLELISLDKCTAVTSSEGQYYIK